MNSIANFIHGLQLRGIYFDLVEGALVSHAAPGAIDAPTAALIREQKPQIVAYFAAHANAAASNDGAGPDYWSSALAGMPEMHALPLDLARPPVPVRPCVTLSRQFGSALHGALAALAQREHSSIAIVLHSALALLLARWSNTEDIVIGIPVDGNVLAVRTVVTAGLDFVDLLCANTTGYATALANQDTTPAQLARASGQGISASHHPVFPIAFSMPGASAAGAESAPARHARYDIAVDVTEDDAGLTMQWTYSQDVFLASSMERMIASFAQVLEEVARDAHLRVYDVALLTAPDRAQLDAWNQTNAAYPRDACVHHMIEAQARRTPERIALVCGDAKLTYRQVNDRANALAARLAGAGVTAGTVVPVIMGGGLAIPLSYLAVMKLGAVFAPLARDWPRNRLLAVLEKMGAPIVLTDGDLPFPLPDTAVWQVDTETLGAAPDYGAAVTPDMPIYIVHTSGSTGEPKGAINLHRGIVNRLHFMSKYFGAHPDEVVLQTTNHCFDSAVWQLFWPLTNGGQCVIPEISDQFDLSGVIALILNRRVTITDFTPALLVLFSEHFSHLSVPERAGCRLRAVIAGGEELTVRAVRRFHDVLPHVRLHNFYGPSETSIGVLCHAINPDDRDLVIPIGQPIDNVIVAIVDRNLVPVPIGVAGELLLGGDCVGAGYFADPEESARRFLPAGTVGLNGGKVYRTGDLVRRRRDGNIEFLGRMDAQVKLRGYRIELGEIQGQLEKLCSVRQAVVQIAGETEDRKLVAYVVPADRQEDPAGFAASLRMTLSEVLPDYMVPNSYVVLARFPLSGSGKVDLKALAQHAPAVIPEKHFVAPATPNELLIAKIWSALFGVTSISVMDDFFALGGHSLLATQFVARLRRQIQRELPLKVLFDNAELGVLARWLDQSEA